MTNFYSQPHELGQSTSEAADRLFRGNCPSNVSKDAKYSVIGSRDSPEIRLVFRTTDGETWTMTEKYPELAAMVNVVKERHQERANGSFYINEYSQVIVPVRRERTSIYYFAGDYPCEKQIEFLFEGKIISGNAVDLEGNALQSGDLWVGPHPGIPYVLDASMRDIYYTSEIRPNVTVRRRLSDFVSPDNLEAVTAMVRRAKRDSGRFYVNEWGNAFAPVSSAHQVEYIFCGKIDVSGNSWFPRDDKIPVGIT